MSSFNYLVRFIDSNGQTRYGNLYSYKPTSEIVGSEVDVLSGSIEDGFTKTSEAATVKTLTIPPYPVVFSKPPDALAGPFDDVPIPAAAQDMLDYEGELTVVVGKTGKDIPESEALSYVLGYTVGNDVSARYFQLPTTSGGQFCYAKSFDAFAPIGPLLASPNAIPDPQTLTYRTKVNGVLRQETGTDDMVWSVKQIIAHLSRGTTLRAGTVIMTGTPSGVGLFMEPKGFLKDGDIVEVEVDGIGSIVNKMVF
ncbi:hypothetical protein V500_10480 [Pseudogymnoascus sp. VKM F-4518 (FW-2643)]|nr:hypothetical protein V500_10480 [Pseudogymnoascus sp. VKM F-4518 (FW-2643)]